MICREVSCLIWSALAPGSCVASGQHWLLPRRLEHSPSLPEPELDTGLAAPNPLPAGSQLHSGVPMATGLDTNLQQVRKVLPFICKQRRGPGRELHYPIQGRFQALQPPIWLPPPHTRRASGLNCVSSPRHKEVGTLQREVLTVWGPPQSHLLACVQPPTLLWGECQCPPNSC